MKQTTDSEVNRVFETFWMPLLGDGNGGVDMEQVKRELYDYRIVLREVSLAYDAITGGKFSKPNTAHEYIIDAADEYYSKLSEEKLT